MRKALAVLSFLLCVGCSDTLVPPTGEPLGTWAANFSVVGASLVLTLDRVDGHISGAGSYAIEAGRAGTLRVSGSYVFPAITIALLYDYGEVLTYRGKFRDANHLRGTLTNPQGQGTPLTFTRR